MLSWDLIQRFGIGKFCKETGRMQREIEQRAWDAYQGRLESGSKKIINMLDLMIEHARQYPEDLEMTKHGIAGMFNLLQFAGADTSRNTSQNFIYYLSDKPELQKKILEEVDSRIYNNPVVDYDIL